MLGRICSNKPLTKCKRGKYKWKEALKEKARGVPGGRRGFSGQRQRMYFGQKSFFCRLLIPCFPRRPWRGVRALVSLPMASLSVRQQLHKAVIMCFIFNPGSGNGNFHVQREAVFWHIQTIGWILTDSSMVDCAEPFFVHEMVCRAERLLMDILAS